MRYDDGWAMHDGGVWWMGLVWLIVLVGLVALAIWVVVTVTRTQAHGRGVGTGRAATTDPEQILAERLARGDIEPDEYRTRLRALRDAHGP